jgi:hypothetical protein
MCCCVQAIRRAPEYGFTKIQADGAALIQETGAVFNNLQKKRSKIVIFCKL